MQIDCGLLCMNHTDAAHVAGKLTWYAEILQSGRVHTASWWRYTRRMREADDELLAQVVRDTDWWLEVLRTWSKDESSQLAYPILNGTELMADPQRITVVVSDSSGVDGHGYYYGKVDEASPQCGAKRCPEGFEPRSSMWGELESLRDFVEGVEEEGVLLVWVSDSLSGVWCINKGRAFSVEEMRVVENVLAACDRKRIQIVGLWIPREHNLIADYLSHLATHLDRDTVEGRLSDLQGPVGGGQAGRGIGTEDEAYQGTVRQYLDWGERNGAAVVPVTVETVAGYLVDWVLELGSSTRSVDGKLSHLRYFFVEAKGEKWLSEPGEGEVARALRQLKYDDYSKP